MLKKILLIVLSVLTAAGCSGCTALLEGDYISVTTYEEKKDEHGETPVDVNNYAELRKTLLSMVENGTGHAVVSVGEYSANITDDMSKACIEVTRNTAIGVYAVDYMTHSYLKYPGYYEMEVYITYKRSIEELFSVRQAGNVSEAVDMLRSMVAAGETDITLRIDSMIVDGEYLQMQMDEIYHSMPDVLLLRPDITVTEYLGNAMDKVIEIHADYVLTDKQIESRMNMLSETANRLCGGVTGETKAEKLSQVCLAAFGDAGGYDSYYNTLLEKTAFASLCGGSGEPEAVAMGVKLLCLRLGIDCSVVFGTFAGREYVWNLVNVDGEDLYVDALRANSGIYIGNADSGQLMFGYDIFEP